MDRKVVRASYEVSRQLIKILKSLSYEEVAVKRSEMDLHTFETTSDYKLVVFPDTSKFIITAFLKNDASEEHIDGEQLLNRGWEGFLELDIELKKPPKVYSKKGLIVIESDESTVRYIAQTAIVNVCRVDTAVHVGTLTNNYGYTLDTVADANKMVDDLITCYNM